MEVLNGHELKGDNTSFLLNDNNLCDDSTYDIAMEFYDDLECFIANHDDDNVEPATDVSEFELLTHHLLNNCEHYIANSDEDHHVSDTFTNSKSTDHDTYHCFYDIAHLESILSEYEDVSKYFDYMIRSCFDISSSKKSDMLHTTTGAEYFVPLGRVLRIINPIISSNLMLED